MNEPLPQGAVERREAGEMLLAWEAAMRLGITPELLFFYTSKSFQRRPGEKRQLPTREVKGSTRFSVADLDAFDRYLRGPWAELGEPRRDPPLRVLAYLHAESGGCCMRCGSGVAVQTAHIDPWATSRCNHHHNLIRICSACHSEHDAHHSLTTEELRRLKALGIERLRAGLRSRLDLRPHFPPPAPDPVFVGREEEIARVLDSMRADRCLLVHGPGGVGKTQLVLRALRAADTGRPVLWIEAERYESVEALRAALEISLCSAHELRAEEVEAALDRMQACLVIDGLEQLKGPGIDAIDEWIANLQARASNAQIIVTSQADLALARIDHHARIAGIEAEASAQVLSHYFRPGIPADVRGLRDLISFADGHPLTLRIAATLVNYYGSISSALGQIRLRGTDSLEIQKRSTQDRRTSLKTCLSLAYDSLTDDERRLLFLVANAPGGLFSRMLEDDKDWLVDARSAIAGAWRWGLIDVKAQGEPRERVRMLSPISSYAIARWREGRPDEAQRLAIELAKSFVVMAAVIATHSEKKGGLPNTLGRFEEELPNLLRVLDLAEGDSADRELGAMATGVCTALMRYFFVIQLGHVGSQVMLRGARLALREGRIRSTSELLTLMVGLASRSQERVDIEPAMAIVDQIGVKSDDSQTMGNLALCRALAASLRQQNDETRAQALVAIARFEEVIAAAAQSSEEGVNFDDIENDLSSAYGLLGGALLVRRECAAAADAYRKSLDLARGQSIAVNAGQLHHQIGNCEAQLGNLLEAALRYLRAADQFRAVGMRGYLANALGEFGNLLLAFGSEGRWPTMPSIDTVEAGVDDLAESIVGSFGQYPFDLGACSAALRNLFGIVVVISLAHEGSSPSLPTTLRTELLPWAEQAVYDMDDIWWDELGSDAVCGLRALLDLEAALAQFERDARIAESGFPDPSGLAAAFHRLGYWGGHRQKGGDWLVVYAARRWGAAGAGWKDLAAKLPEWNAGEPLPIVSRERNA